MEASASSRTSKTNQNKKTETKTKESGEPKQAKRPPRRFYYCSCDHSTFPSPSLWLFCHVPHRTAHASACHTDSTGPHSEVRSVQVNDGPHLTSLREFQEGPGHHKPHPGSLPTCWVLFSPLNLELTVTSYDFTSFYTLYSVSALRHPDFWRSQPLCLASKLFS